MQVSSKPSSTNNVFVFSRSASKLNLNCNSTSDDCTQSGGTGDSGFGDIKHTLSEEARQRKLHHKYWRGKRDWKYIYMYT